jgi:hypothetical protein
VNNKYIAPDPKFVCCWNINNKYFKHWQPDESKLK